jgi:hypothetical protein
MGKILYFWRNGRADTTDGMVAQACDNAKKENKRL